MNTNNGWLDIDQQRLALWQAIQEIKIGNLHDDKVIVANLHRAGYVIAAAASCLTCNDQGAVGNILTAEPCQDCTPPASAQDGHCCERAQAQGTDVCDECAQENDQLREAWTAPASAQDEPITVSLDPDPRGVSVGVWQGSRCIYNGAHPVPASAQDDPKEERPYCYALETRGRHAGIDDVLLDVEYNGTDNFSGGRTGGIPLHRRPAPAAGDARDSQRLEWIAQNAWAIRDLENGRKNALVWQQPRTAPEGALYRLRGAIDAARAASQQQEG